MIDAAHDRQSRVTSTLLGTPARIGAATPGGSMTATASPPPDPSISGTSDIVGAQPHTDSRASPATRSVLARTPKPAPVPTVDVMIGTRTRVVAAIATLCLVGPLAGCTSSSDTATSVASSTAPAASAPFAAETASPVAEASGVDTSTTTGRTATRGSTGTGPAGPSFGGSAVALTIGTDDSPGVPNADEISHFVATGEDVCSGGLITIEPTWHADGDGHLDWDQQVAAMVQNGKLDLALGPTWAWDVLKVKSFEPLQSPFLVDSDPLVAAIVADQDLSTQLMSGMPAAGVTGLALWPEGLRHPFGFDRPLVAADQYRGQTMRSPDIRGIDGDLQGAGCENHCRGTELHHDGRTPVRIRVQPQRDRRRQRHLLPESERAVRERG